MVKTVVKNGEILNIFLLKSCWIKRLLLSLPFEEIARSNRRPIHKDATIVISLFIFY